jgi:hypothetical protein
VKLVAVPATGRIIGMASGLPVRATVTFFRRTLPLRKLVCAATSPALGVAESACGNVRFALAVVLTPIVVTREVVRMVHAEHRNGTGDLALAVLNQAAVEEGGGGYVPTDLGFFSTF